MPQNEFIELRQKRYGYRLNYFEKQRKKQARNRKMASKMSKRLKGIRAKLYHKQRYAEKAKLRKLISQFNEKTTKKKQKTPQLEGALPTYLLDRETVSRSKVLSQTIKQKRKEKAGKWNVPLPKVRPISDDEMFKVMRTGKRKRKQWKRVVTKATFVGENFTRKPPKYERFIRPVSLRYKKAQVVHPELKTTFSLDILKIKKNPSGTLYTQLGVITKGTIIEVNVSDLGIVTPGGRVVWGKFAQVTNNPENDGVINAVLLV
ncbi:ribosome biogenesis protein nsa2 [Anaeramoeba flamelloides]|uniref:Ribosome biogenesis protein NSA2 homolog n=1 Tax=Anaeramoeba flamelloides TaxID=1746091 RepID=A0AAV8A883_9EUKA|nr:ribosome biogenesis protein nsa2 [Anaeramoeba flamelloides]KAJ3449002.1 ribosome biogenesis protein nsa2 [Anaeramoeba flamelloides]KAJ3449584.1 ribosome biogenesis protein nsa2 [Anaeramoeba flamelloides]KAJ3452637.1 ribosome biogenesis protein nsa2 [Anaeramoeba flamelloides]KAJ6236020.1 ribosome biogenesis protein nsa2 [Anaeramoeba flamelloides]|eukprot:Anaeramoba_flamelloidesa574898_98.p1 GENE.a574898_98~~a574898_98.p1  ORF type:complete len:261 (+),score=66.54 a574898_98:72-854(+)